MSELHRLLAALVAVPTLLMPVGAAQAQSDDPVVSGCLEPTPPHSANNESLTNRLLQAEDLHAIRLNREDGPYRFRTYFMTRLQEDDASQQNFEINARLVDGAHIAPDGAIQVTADASDEETIRVAICLDPSPAGNELAVGDYRATVHFSDERIPETSFDFVVLVGDPNRAGFLFMVLVGLAILVLALPFLVASGAIFVGRSWRGELHRSRRLLVCLIVVAVAGYTWAVLGFLDSEDYVLWKLGYDGLASFGGYAYKVVAGFLTVLIGGLALVPQFRETLGITPFEAVEPHAPVGSPLPPPLPMPARPPTPLAIADSQSRPRVARRLVLAAAVATVLGLASAVVIVGRFDSIQQSPAGTTPAAPVPSSTGPVPTSSTTVGPSQATTLPPTSGAQATTVPRSTVSRTTVQQATAPPRTTMPRTTVPSSQGVLDTMTVGLTGGQEAASALRNAGFVVFAFNVCSNSVPTAGLLRQVRATESQAILVDKGGTTDAGRSIGPGASLDVLIASGAACD